MACFCCDLHAIQAFLCFLVSSALRKLANCVAEVWYNVFQLTAYHESGHAIVALNTDGAHPIHKATIMPRGSALGMVTQLPSSDETSISKKQLLARLDVCMGGRVAEEIIFGNDHITTGASSDFNTATELAQYMVWFYSTSFRDCLL